MKSVLCLGLEVQEGGLGWGLGFVCMSQFVMSWFPLQMTSSRSALTGSAVLSEPATTSSSTLQHGNSSSPTARGSALFSGKRKRLREESPVQTDAVSVLVFYVYQGTGSM